MPDEKNGTAQQTQTRLIESICGWMDASY